MEIFTIGSSLLTESEFLNNLRKYNIDALVDVRSVPFSNFTPQFNENNLKIFLRKNKIHYIPMSKEFGARRVEKDAYSGNKVDFIKTANLPIFKEGIKRIEKGLKKGLRIALMCTEKDPLDCHRFILVSRNLKKELGVDVNHIHIDGSIESNELLEQRLIFLSGREKNMFHNNEHDLLEECYLAIGTQISYSESNQVNDK
ncbi:MAG: DUF488 domain-containing protein [Cytophagales bacterium]|nr:DUF488 domain-containing protein [Cytophagales bacterium]